jgi:hypothetical protein
MSDLTGKFGALSTQMATQHTEMMDALNTIAYALGAPPSAPTITLEDVVTAITETNTLISGIRSDMNEQLTAIFNTLDTINNNNALNAQRILAIMLQTACDCDSTTPLLPLPIDTTPIELANDEKCQRIQYLLDLFRSFVIVTGSYLALNGNITSSQVNSLLSSVLAEVDITDTELNDMPVSTRNSITYLLNSEGTPGDVNAALFYAINSTDLLIDMRQALYSEDNASAGHSAVIAAIGAYEPYPDGVLSAMFYSGWANVMYGALPVIDASMYDGDICDPDAPELIMAIPVIGCLSAQSIEAIMGDSSHLQIIEWAHGTNSNYIGPELIQTSDHDVWGLDDLYGLWVSATPTCQAFLDATGYPNIYVSSTPQQITVHTNNRYAFLTASTQFVLTICVDEPE